MHYNFQLMTQQLSNKLWWHFRINLHYYSPPILWMIPITLPYIWRTHHLHYVDLIKYFNYLHHSAQERNLMPIIISISSKTFLNVFQKLSDTVVAIISDNFAKQTRSVEENFRKHPHCSFVSCSSYRFNVSVTDVPNYYENELSKVGRFM